MRGYYGNDYAIYRAIVTKKERGEQGERLAERHYLENGYRVLARNYRIRAGEVDLVILKNNTVVFAEVRGRENLQYGLPEETVTLSKQKKIIKTSLSFLCKYKLFDCDVRFDVYCVIWGEKKPVRSYLIENAFEYSD